MIHYFCIISKQHEDRFYNVRYNISIVYPQENCIPRLTRLRVSYSANIELLDSESIW